MCLKEGPSEAGRNVKFSIRMRKDKHRTSKFNERNRQLFDHF